MVVQIETFAIGQFQFHNPHIVACNPIVASEAEVYWTNSETVNLLAW